MRSPLWVITLRLVLPIIGSSVFFLHAAATGLAQSHTIETTFDHISINEGLSNIAVTAILQDHEGFMWFGTLDGLCRYDGNEMLVFRNIPEDTSSISDNVVWALCEDHNTTLWVGTYSGGINQFDRATQRFTRFISSAKTSRSFGVNTVRVIEKGQRGNLLVGTYGGGFYELNPLTHEFMHERDALLGSSQRAFIRSIQEDSSGRVWLGTRDSGLYVLGVSRNIVHHYKVERGSQHGLPSNSVGPILFDKAGGAWIGTTKGLTRFDQRTQQFTVIPIAGGNPVDNDDLSITSLAFGDEHIMWIGTYANGLYRLEIASGRSVRFAPDPKLTTSLTDISVRTLYTDRTGNLWVGTSNGGVNKINTERQPFGILKHDPEDHNSIGPGETWAIFEGSDGTVWIGTSDGGLDALNRESGVIKHHRHDPENAGTISSNAVSAILEDKRGILWIGTRGGGLNRFDRKRNTWAHLKNDPSDINSLGRNQVSAILEDGDSVLWIGTWEGGLNRFDRKSSKFTRLVHRPEDPKSLAHDRIAALWQDKYGGIWIATEGGGLDKFDRASGTFHHFRNSALDSTTLSNDRAYCVYGDNEGILWVGTASGLNRLDLKGHTFKRYSTADGLASDYIRSIVSDSQGRLWLSTSKGLSRFDPNGHGVKNYDILNGLPSTEFTRAGCRAKDGTLFFGSIDGIAFFRPEEISHNWNVPPIVITRFLIFEKPAANGPSMLASRSIRLSYSQDFFSFTFAALDYTNPSKNQYAYRLDGFDNDWISVGNRRYASYTNLDPGSYTFQVRGANNDGLWNLPGTSLEIVIDPPFWQTWWFRSLAVISFAGALLGIHTYRVSKLLEIERMRVRIASDLHDDVGSNLSSIALITDMVRGTLTPLSAQHDQLKAVSLAARHTADSLRDIVWLIAPEHDKVDDIALRMKDSAAKLLAGIEYSFHGNTNNLGQTLDMEFRRNVLLIYKEAVNNIAKYAKATKVDISIEELAGTFTLSIVDNGVGFDLNTVKKGNGLNNLHLRASKIGGLMEIRSTPGKGTSIELKARIP